MIEKAVFYLNILTDPDFYASLQLLVVSNAYFYTPSNSRTLHTENGRTEKRQRNINMHLILFATLMVIGLFDRILHNARATKKHKFIRWLLT